MVQPDLYDANGYSRLTLKFQKQ